jgi:hypothetical protein
MKNMLVMELVWNLGEEGKEKRTIVNNVEIHYICADEDTMICIESC